MERKKAVFPIAMILVAAVMASQPTVAAAQAAGANATGIIQRANAAMGCNLVRTNTSISVQGLLKASSIPSPMPLRIDSLGNDRWRSALDTPKERKVTVVNSGKGQVQHADGSTAPLADHNISHQRPMHIPCLTNLALGPSAVEETLVRTESAGTETFDVVDLQLTGRPNAKRAADLMKTTVWISRSTGYLAKLQYVNAAEQDSNDSQTVDIEYSDYRVVDGLAVPFHQVTRSGQLILDLHLDSVQLNGSAADFSLR